MVQLPLTSYRNQLLFSDHYLADVLPKDPLWQLLIAETRPAMEKIAALYHAYTPSNKEGQIERELIRPVLEALGHTFEVMPSLQMPGSPQTPDYVFYQDQAALVANKRKMLTDTLPTHGAYAIGEAEHWDCPLDVPTKGASAKLLTNGNPSYQIASYVQHSGLDWGILTNGRHWRLYHRTTAHKLDRFYDVDLRALIATDDPAQFAWFFGFFRREAFRDMPAVGRGLDYILHESTSYAQTVSELLKAQVYKALLDIAQGFLDYPANHLSPDDPGTLKEIYDNSLILLYRLLFIFYAEARGLLPVGTNAGYNDEYSLFRIARSGAQAIDKGTPLLAKGAKLWQSLKDLFAIINGGNREFGVATFNGGLFDPAKHPFLEQYTVGDARLRQAIDALARADVRSMQTGSKKGDTNREFVDYRDLSERHLGTIYEGLLEFRLLPREPDTQMKFALMAGDADQWTVDIRNDKGERKVTGSYYTPDYIVKYIVEQTVLPVLDAAIAQEADYDAKIAAVLAVKVLDPAMGSGHFLVEATEQIARYLLNLTPPENDTAEPRVLAYWKRRVVQSCIFGVDLNPLAVELAKLSLWLATVAKDQPLSFLDHHLRVGNALIGARVADLDMLGDPAFQAQVRQAIVQVGTIEASAAADAHAVKEQERIYATLRTALTERYRIVADAYVARYFGADYPAGEWGPFRDWLIGRNSDPQPRYDAWRTSIAAMARDRHFFHWELEFPEVFFAADGTPKEDDAGFDAVIGNPPYLNAWAMTGKMPQERSAIDALFEKAGGLEGHWDLYIPFVVQALNLARQGGNHSFILPNPVLREKYATALRKSLLSDYSLQSILGFGEENVFEDVSRQCVVYIVRKDAAIASEQSLRLATASNPLSYREIAIVDNEVWLNAYNYQIRNDAHYVACLPTLHKIEQASNLLGQYLYVNVGATVSSKKTKEFTKNDVVTSSPVGNAQRFFDGTNVGRWDIEWRGQWLDYRENAMSGPRSPQMFEAEKLLVRVRTGENERLIAAYDDTKMYCDHTVVVCCRYEDMEGSKAKSSFDGYAKIDVELDLKCILALINSTVLSWFFQTKFATGALQGTFSDVWPQSIRAFPIRRFALTTPHEERVALLEQWNVLVRNRDDSAITSFIVGMPCCGPGASRCYT